MTPRPFRILAYDFDGTLVDTKDDIAFSVNLALAELGLPPRPAGEVFGYIGRGVLNLMRRAIDGTGFTDAEHAVAVFRKHYREHLLDRTGFYPHCRETLDHFAHKTQAIVSNKPVEFIENILAALESRERFSAVLGGDSVQNKKPHPEGLQRLMAEHGAAPGDVLFIGDSALDIETGKNAGAATCGVSWGLNPVTEIAAARPDFLIHDMNELKRLAV